MTTPKKFDFLNEPKPGQPSAPVPPAPIYHHTTIIAAPAQSQALPALVNFFCFPGLGQLIQGRVMAALVWWGLHLVCAALCVVGIGFFIWPIVWIGCVIDAARYDPRAGGEPASFGLVLGVGLGGLLVVGGAFVIVAMSIISAISTVSDHRPVAQNPPTAQKPALSESPPQPPPEPKPFIVLPEEPKQPEPAAEIPIVPAAVAPAPESAKPFEPPPKSREQLIDEAKWRTWRAKEGGFSVDAKFIRFGAGMVTLEKRDGKVISVDIEILSPDDGDFIRKQKWMQAAD
jgi:TM2 domain-containing membrane protein YozV